MLNLERLRIFVTAAETENFSRAAQRLHVSQPSVSQHIRSLEQHLGVALFERRGRRISLSASGEALLPAVQELIRLSRQVEESALALAGEVSGHLTIGCSTTSGKYILPKLLARYREKYSQVRATIKVGSRIDVVDWLMTGEVSLSVASDRVQRSGLRYRRFFEDEVVMIVPYRHPWSQRTTVSATELYRERFILREPRSGTHAALLEGLDQVGIDLDRLETVLILDNSEAITMAVEEGIGLGFVPRVAAERSEAWGKLRVVDIDGVSMKRWIYLIENTHMPQTPALNAFWSFVDKFIPRRAEEVPFPQDTEAPDGTLIALLHRG